VVISAIIFPGAGDAWAAEGKPAAEELYGPEGIEFIPIVPFKKIVLTISFPNGQVARKTFKEAPRLDISESWGPEFTDGSYTFELRVITAKVPDKRLRETGYGGINTPGPVLQTGSFYIHHGGILPRDAKEESNTPLKQEPAGSGEELSATSDYCYIDDMIVEASLCVGIDCLCDHSFGFDTIVLKENNLRIFFDDTSWEAGRPNNDWRILINDTSNGSANYFSVEDATAERRVFTVEAGAPSHALYVDDGGKVGLGTSTPATDLHVMKGDTPTLRLEQDGSGGFSAQTFEIAGNEANFFIRDVTNGATLPFRIQPGLPHSALTLKTAGVGIGTWYPSAPLHILTDSSTPALVLAERTSGATVQFSAGASSTFFGSRSNHPLNLIVDQDTMMYIDTSGNVAIKNGSTSITAGRKIDTDTGGYLTSGGVWQSTSTRASKENIKDLETGKAIDAFEKLKPVTFNYKKEKGEQYVGFIADDVPALVANNDRSALNAMDVVAVLTKVVQEQQKTIRELKEAVKELKKNQKKN
jgi:hypothetical protein